jgi:hypothetical protein
LPTAETNPPALILPLTEILSPNWLPEIFKVWANTVLKRWVSEPMLRKFPVLGSMSVSTTILPTPLGDSCRFPLVSRVDMALLAICMLLSTGPAAKI